MVKLKKDKRIKKYLKEFESICKDLSEEKQKISRTLNENLAFMRATLEDLKDEVNKNGSVYLFEQGKQKMMIENPAQKTYNTLINRYTTTLKQLNELLESEESLKTVEGDGFEVFIDS